MIEKCLGLCVNCSENSLSSVSSADDFVGIANKFGSALESLIDIIGKLLE